MAPPRVYVVRLSFPPADPWQGLDFFSFSNDLGAQLCARVGNAGPWVPRTQAQLIVGVDFVLQRSVGGTALTPAVWVAGP